MAWTPSSAAVGDRVLVKFFRDEMYHERLLGAELGLSGWWMVAAPDYEVSPMDLQNLGDIESVIRMPSDRSLPYGLRESDVNLFYDGRRKNKDISNARLGSLIQRCEDAAARWRLQWLPAARWI
jgi:hypothetical protein